MIRGLIDSGGAMMARSLQTDITSNNLANTQTTGFKLDRLNFRELIDHRLVVDRGRGVPNPETRLRSGMETRWTEGPLEATGAELDFALEGPGFFAIEGLDGREHYTRNGHFLLADDGSLVTSEGLPVLGDAGAIQLGPGPVELSGDGQLVQGGAVVGRLKLVEFEDRSFLAKLGHTLFVPTDEDKAGPRTAEGTRAHQGSLEGSNGGVVELMVGMIEQEKMFTFAQRALRTHDENLARAVGELGRVDIK